MSDEHDASDEPAPDSASNGPSRAKDLVPVDPLTHDDSQLDEIGDNIDRYHAAALAGLEQEKAGSKSWWEASWALACEMKRSKERCQNSNRAFSEWLQARASKI